MNQGKVVPPKQGSIRPALREYCTWSADSRRWAPYRPRSGDIVIATYPKCGTTWMQQIVSSLVFQDAVPRPLSHVSPWIDGRHYGDVEAIYAVFNQQRHRRFAKTHLPADGIPLYEEVQYIHVGRDGRDAAMPLHNQWTGFSDRHRQNFDRLGQADPRIGRPFPDIPSDPAELFRFWLAKSEIPGQDEGGIGLSFFDFETSYWKERHRPNVLLAHYNDLLIDLDGEMRRIAAFLGFPINEALWPALVNAARFSEMQASGDLLMPEMRHTRKDGARGFFY